MIFAVTLFVQADSIVPGAGNPDAWDRYSYTFNNPLRYTDPSGHGPSCDDGDWDGCPNKPTPPAPPPPIPGPIVINGGSYPDQPHDQGPPVSTQMPVWTTDLNNNAVNTIDYPGTLNYGSPNQISAKYYMSILNRDEAPTDTAVILICYSGGAEACLMYAKWRIDNKMPVHSVSLLGPTFSASNEFGIEIGYHSTGSQFSGWIDYIQYIRNTGGASVLIINDSVDSATAAAGDPDYHDIGPIFHYSDDPNIPGTNNSTSVKWSVYNWIFNNAWVQP